MKLIPRSFDLFGTPFEDWGSLINFKNSMNTDIVEGKNDVKMIIDLPGVKKENVKITLEKGVLTIHASTDTKSEEKDEKGNYIRRERHSGEYTRSFTVGENISKDDVKAKLEDGILTICIPKNIEKEPSSQTVEIQ